MSRVFQVAPGNSLGAFPESFEYQSLYLLSTTTTAATTPATITLHDGNASHKTPSIGRVFFFLSFKFFENNHRDDDDVW